MKLSECATNEELTVTGKGSKSFGSKIKKTRWI